MSEALQLFETDEVVKLTPRQQDVVDAVRRAGHDGLLTEEAGALLHARAGKHDADETCRWCGADGRSVLRGELEPKGLVTYRRGRSGQPGAWIAVASNDGAKQEPGAIPADTADDERGVYNSFPAGF